MFLDGDKKGKGFVVVLLKVVVKGFFGFDEDDEFMSFDEEV